MTHDTRTPIARTPNWAEQMKTRRAELGRPLTLDELMQSSEAYKNASRDSAVPEPGARPKDD